MTWRRKNKEVGATVATDVVGTFEEVVAVTEDMEAAAGDFAVMVAMAGNKL